MWNCGYPGQNQLLVYQRVTLPVRAQTCRRKRVGRHRSRATCPGFLIFSERFSTVKSWTHIVYMHGTCTEQHHNITYKNQHIIVITHLLSLSLALQLINVLCVFNMFVSIYSKIKSVCIMLSYIHVYIYIYTQYVHMYIYIYYIHTYIYTGWWFQPVWKILVS